MQPIIYVAGPYRAPDRESIARNIEAAKLGDQADVPEELMQS